MGGLTPPRPLERGDDRQVFDCGRQSLNLWFQRHAWRNQQGDASRVSVVSEGMNGRIAGFVALSAAQIERGYLPKSEQRNKPDPLPVILMGQLAVDINYRQRRVGASLLQFAFSTTKKFASEIGCFGILTHPLDDDERNFYRRFGFEELNSDPKRSMIVRIIELRRNDF